MLENAVRIVAYTKEEKQICYASNEYNDVFKSNGYDANELSKKEIEGVLQKTSSKRSYYFFVFSKDNHRISYGTLNPVAVYGVKGGISTGRSKMYIETFACDKEKLKGDGFYNNAIKTSYINVIDGNKAYNTEEELRRTVNEISQRGEYATGNISRYLPSDAKKVLSRILREYDSVESRIKIVLFLEDAENSSLPFLGVMYNFFPFELRNKLGFMTNVDASDMSVINSSISSVVFTIMDSSLIDSIHVDDLNVLIIDVRDPYYDFSKEENEKEGEYAEYMELLDKVEKELKRGAGARRQFDKAERQVMKTKQSGNELNAYKEIANTFLNQQTIFYEDNSIRTIQDLVEKSKEQESYWEDEEDRAEALKATKAKIFETQALYADLVGIVFDGDRPNREQLLDYCIRSLDLDSIIDPLTKIYDDSDKTISACKKDANTFRDEKETLEEKNKELKEQITKLNNDKTNLETEISNLKKGNKNRKQINQDTEDKNDSDPQGEDCGKPNPRESRSSGNRIDIITHKELVALTVGGLVIGIVVFMLSIAILIIGKMSYTKIIHKLDTINATVEGRGNEINTLDDSTADERSSEVIGMSNSPSNIHFSANGVEGGNPGMAPEQMSATGSNQTREEGTDDN